MNDAIAAYENSLNSKPYKCSETSITTASGRRRNNAVRIRSHCCANIITEVDRSPSIHPLFMLEDATDRQVMTKGRWRKSTKKGRYASQKEKDGIRRADLLLSHRLT